MNGQAIKASAKGLVNQINRRSWRLYGASTCVCGLAYDTREEARALHNITRRKVVFFFFWLMSHGLTI